MPDNDLLLQKTDRWFRLLDLDDNGFIELADFEAVAFRLMKGYGRSPADPVGARLLAAYEGMWASLCARADADGDEQVTRDELLEVMRSGEAASVQAIGEAADAVFSLVDTDDDGRLDGEEVRRILSFFGVPRGMSDRAFESLDTDGDGAVSEQEWAKAFQDFYLGTDTSSPANVLFGSW